MAGDFIHRIFLDVGNSSPEGFALKSALGFGREEDQKAAAARLGCSREWLRKLERRIETRLENSKPSNGMRLKF